MAADDERKLFVAGLPDSITEDVLRDLFRAAGGEVVAVSLPRDRTTGRPRGFAFVTLASAEEAQSTRTALDGSTQAGRPMSVRPFQSEAPRREARDSGARGVSPPDRDRDRGDRGGDRDRGSDRTLYVGNLPYDATQESVETLFREYEAGAVVRVHLPQGPDGRPRGFGFVTMATSEAAVQAVTALRDADMRGRRLMVNIAHPRGERPERPERPDRSPRAGGEEREHRPPRETSVRPSYSGGPPSFPMDPPFPDPQKAEGRRRGERPEKKPKKRRAGGERTTAGPKRGREKNRGWDDWDDD